MTKPKQQEKEENAPAADSVEGTAPAEASKETPPGDKTGEKIAQLEAEVAKFRDQWMRAVAETENVRKRAQRDQEDTARYAIASFARDLVNVIENLKRALETIPPEARKEEGLLKTVAEGVELTQREMLSVFEKFGVRRISPEGQKFDHNLHQAVVQVERSDVAPGTVVQVVQAGYVLHERLLRPAMVAVAKAPETPKKVDETA